MSCRATTVAQQHIHAARCCKPCAQPPANRLLAHSAATVVCHVATGLEEVVVRRYSLQAAHGGSLAVVPAGAEGKPPGSGLGGTVIEATIQLRPSPHEAAAADWGGGLHPHMHAGVSPALLPASAEEVAGSLQQLLGMLRVLAPPVQLLMRLDGVMLQVGAQLCCWNCHPVLHDA